MNHELGISFLNRSQDDADILELLKSLNSDYEDLNEQEYSWLRTHEMEKWDEYLKFRHSFRNDANEEKKTNYPIYMVIEPSSFCNLKCVMCFQCDDKLKAHGGFMSIACWKKVIDEASTSGCQALTIAGRGEPLLNKNIIDMFDYLKNKFMEIKLNTNGILMNDDIARSILRNDINVVFSAEGSNEMEYSRIRKGGNFNKLVANIKRFREIKQTEFPDSLSKTRVCGVAFDEIDIKQYYEFWESLVDEVAITEYEERKNTYQNNRNIEKSRCARLWQRVYVWWDGQVSPCDVDYLNKLTMGNVNNNSITEIWNGELFSNIRRLHQKGQRNQIIPCDRCEFTDI